MKTLIAVSILLLLRTVAAKTAEEWKTRVIYQLLTDRFAHNENDPTTSCTNLRGWCGGTFKGIQRRLDYIRQLGANAIWISPISLNTEGGYHGYWAKDLFQIENHFGTEKDLKELVEECHRNDIWVMVDVVPNHMGYPPGCDWNPCEKDKLVNFTGFVPFNLPEHYHALCEIDFSNKNQTQLEVCRLSNLPDLNQTVPFVRETLLSWLSNLTRDYNFDGYRVDTVRHIAKDFWPEYQNAAGVFLTGEVAGDDTAYTADYQRYMDSVLNFPTYWALRRVFNDGENMTVLSDNLMEQRRLFRDVSVLGLFSENHDKHRFLNLTNDMSLYKNVLVYNILAEGIPVIYYGSEQGFSGGGDPDNRESLWPYGDANSTMFRYMKTLVSYRKKNGYFVNQPIKELYVTVRGFVFSRGAQHETFVVMTNYGSGRVVTVTLKEEHLSGIKDGTEYSEVFSSKKLVVTGCQINYILINGEPAVFERKREGTGRTCYASSKATTLKFGLFQKVITFLCLILLLNSPN